MSRYVPLPGLTQYYDEGALIWLAADTLIRERSGGKRSLDDFARAFFGIDDGSYTPVTYTFEDVAKALNAVEPYDWSAFLRARLDGVRGSGPLDGLRRSGYRLVFNDTPNEIMTSAAGSDPSEKVVDLMLGVGVRIGKMGKLRGVQWDGPAFKAGLKVGDEIIAVNERPYVDDLVDDAIQAAETDAAPMQWIVKTADRVKVVQIDYHGGLRYPHLERDPQAPDILDDILAPRK